MKRTMLIVCALLACTTTLATAGSAQFRANAMGVDGAGTSASGVSCEGGTSTAWSFAYSAALPAGAMSRDAAQLGLALEVRSEAPFDRAWLHADDSRAVLQDARGTIELSLSSGECTRRTLAFDGATVSGSGTWTVVGTGAYRDVTGSGTFSLTAQLTPGLQNAFQLQLDGRLDVPDPALEVELVSARWEPGSDAGDRTALVTFRVRNTGLGDAFNVQVIGSASSTPNVTSASGTAALGHVAVNSEVLVERRFRVARPRPRTFDVLFEVDMPDALDTSLLLSQPVAAIRVPTHH